MLDWRTSTAGAKVRAALWLHSEVGEGGVFTKAALRAAFPNVEQIDRRMRELRDEGWVISTYREDPSLNSDELRLVREGDRVWERGYRSRRDRTIPDKDRRALFARDNYMCRYCGIGAGETYPDDPLRTAKLTISRKRGGAEQSLTLCDRCRVGSQEDPGIAGLLRTIGELTSPQKDELRDWIRQGRRQPGPAEVIWARYCRLPQDARVALEKALTQ